MALTPSKISAMTLISAAGRYFSPQAMSGDTGKFRRVDNLSATTSPTKNDDATGTTKEYHIGSRWFRVDTGQEWVCRDATVGAAVWVATGGQSLLGANRFQMPRGYKIASAAVSTLNVIKLVPYGRLRRPETISSLMVRVSTGGAFNFQVAIYANNPATDRPTGTALSSSASVATTGSTNMEAALTAAQRIEANLGIACWLAFNTDSSTPTYITVDNSGPSLLAEELGSTTAANLCANATGLLTHLTVAQTFGTWPDLTSGSFTEASTNCPMLFPKISTVY